MRLHLVSVPHSQTTREYGSCAFTEKVRKFADMMSGLGHEVILYAGDENDAACAELVTCISRAEQHALNIPSPERVFDASFDADAPQWKLFNCRAVEGIAARKQPRDRICIIGGRSSASILEAHGDLLGVEFGIGYPGSFAKCRVFESYAWMHATYGAQQGLASANGGWYDTVIPSYFEPDAFPLGDGSGDYLFFIGRLTERKGLAVIKDVMQRTGLPLVVAGDGDRSLIPQGAEYFGHANPAQRARLFGRARVTLVPTVYVEPFGSAACESMMCGTPVLTTDWGAFTETVEQGVNGWRCRDLGEFAWGVDHVKDLSRENIRDRALARFSMDVVALQYEQYFQRLQDLDGPGWYTTREREPGR